MSEGQRHSVATAGVVLWLAFPFVYLASSHARWVRRCGGRSFTGKFDDCFNDALPVLEFAAFPITVALAYMFSRFAFSMFAPTAELRTLKWRLAGHDGGADAFPLYQLFAVIGLIWAILHIRSIPMTITYWYLFVYWLVWLAWFLIGAATSLPPNGQEGT